MNKQTQKITIWRVLAYFIIYSFIGYVVETLFALINYNVIESRKSFLYGPFCGIYGVGAIALILALRYFNKNNYTLFFGGCLTGSVIEYTMSFLGEIFFGARWWDYSNRFLNINGRICLLYTLFWGILSLILMRIINPQIDKFIDSIKHNLSTKWIKFIIFIASVLMAANVILSGIAVELFLIRVSVENNIDVKNRDMVQIIYNKTYNNPKTKAFLNTFCGEYKMIKTFPNIKITTKDGKTVFVRTFFPNIKPYYYKF